MLLPVGWLSQSCVFLVQNETHCFINSLVLREAVTVLCVTSLWDRPGYEI